MHLFLVVSIDNQQLLKYRTDLFKVFFFFFHWDTDLFVLVVILLASSAFN